MTTTTKPVPPVVAVPAPVGLLTPRPTVCLYDETHPPRYHLGKKIGPGIFVNVEPATGDTIYCAHVDGQGLDNPALIKRVTAVALVADLNADRNARIQRARAKHETDTREERQRAARIAAGAHDVANEAALEVEAAGAHDVANEAALEVEAEAAFQASLVGMTSDQRARAEAQHEEEQAAREAAQEQIDAAAEAADEAAEAAAAKKAAK